MQVRAFKRYISLMIKTLKMSENDTCLCHIFAFHFDVKVPFSVY